MTESLVQRPAEPVEDGVTYGGFAEIARRLNARFPERTTPISRQLVAKWYECREFNGFPERRDVEVGEGRVKALFDLAAVDRWHTAWRLTRVRPAPRPPLETLPLFQLDVRGHPIDDEQSAHRGHPEMREDYRSSVLDL